MELNHLLYLQETIKLECEGVMHSEPANQALFNRLFVQYMTINTKAMALLSKEPSPDSVDGILRDLESMAAKREIMFSKREDSIFNPKPSSIDILQKNYCEDETVDEILESLHSCCSARQSDL